MEETAAALPSLAASAPALDELNEPQARAAAHVDGPLLVFAGAGSGKTRVITYRIANLCARVRVPPYRILAVTFTNKAASEMRRRLQGLLGEEIARDLWIGTFHAVCARLLRRMHEAAGLQSNFLIYDDHDQRSLMNRVVKDLKIDDKRYPPKQILGRIHRHKQEGGGPQTFAANDYFDEVVARCFTAYAERMRDANAVDFDDLIVSVLHIAEDATSAAGRDLRARFRYVLVDEFQDVNQAQYRLVRALAAERRNLCVVGDDDQSIYRWRGADVRNIRGFRRDFPDATVVKLEQNYRSTGHIVNSALGVIRPSREREPKELWTGNPEGDQVLVVATLNEHDEAAWVVDRVRELIAHDVPARELAVFYRTHAQSRVLEELMRSAKVPYQIIGGMRFFERAEVKDLIAYLRFIDNPRSDVDLLRIINVPARKIGDSTVEKLIQAATIAGTPVYPAILPAVERGAISGPAKKSLVAFVELIEALREEAKTLAPSEIARHVLERSGYEDALLAEDSAEADARQQNLHELLGSIEEYEQEMEAMAQRPALAGYLERITLSSDVDALEETGRVAMMTVHAAKGLEFDTVFVTGMEEEVFPFKGLDPSRAEDVEEERRLAYVALTRARKRLGITFAHRRTIFGMTRHGRPSRFIADLPRGSIRTMATSAASLEAAAGRYIDRNVALMQPRARWQHPQEAAMPRAERPAREPGERYVEPDDSGSAPLLDLGDRVAHPSFGFGEIVSIDSGDDPTVTVSFSGWGRKRIKARFLTRA